jgi:hypothetical protein
VSKDWRPLFHRFISELRIASKEVSSGTDPRGSKMSLWTSQQRFLDLVIDGLADGVHDFTCLKSRQLGITTVSLAIDLFWLAVHPGMLGALVVDTETNREAFRDVLRRYVQSFPKGFLGKSFAIVKGGDNRNFMKFSNNSRLDFLVAGTTAKKNTWGESRGYALAHMCVAPGTPVIGENGRVKPIEDVRIGDQLLTHTGALTTVVDVFGQPNHKGPMMRITPWLGQPLLCSLDHTIPTLRGTIKAHELRPDDRLLMPVRPIDARIGGAILPESPGRSGRYAVDARGRFTSGADGNVLVRERKPWTNILGAGSGLAIPFTEETGFAIGYYLAEGSIIRNGYSAASGITFTRHRTEVAYADRAIAALAPFTTGHRNTVDRPGSLTSQDVIYSTPLAGWIDATFGSADNKIIPDDVFSWGEDFCRGLLAGLLSGDGSKTVDNVAVMPTTRSSLATQARDIAAALGCGWAAIGYQPAGVHHGRNCKASWRVFWNGEAAASLRRLIGLQPAATGRPYVQKYVIQDGLVSIRIRKIEYGIEQPYMWDVSVDHPDHSFRSLHFSIGNTEVAKYGSAEGISSFEEGLAETNPERLFMRESTAYGMNHWRDQWREAGRDPLTKRRLFVGWWSKSLNSIPTTDRRFAIYGVDPPNEEEQELIDKVAEDYDWTVTAEQLAWYRWRSSNQSTSAESLDQNQPWYAEQAFVLSGYSFFQIRKLQEQFDEIGNADPPIEYEGFRFWLGNDFFASKMEKIYTMERRHEVELRVWEQPIKDATYVIGCDPAMGRNDNKDRHAISVWRCFADKIVQVAEYADNSVETRQAAWVLAFLAGAYRNCMINLEITGGYGQTVMTELDNVRNQLRADVYAEKVASFGWGDFLNTARWYLYHKPDSPGAGYVYNWNSTFDAKNRMLSAFRDAHITDALVPRSLLLLDEMSIVVQDGGEIGAPNKGKDDRVFAAALACEAWNRWFRPQMLAEGYLYEFVTAEERGDISATRSLVGRLVQNTLKRMSEDADDEELAADPQRIFLVDRGLRL